MISYLSYCQLDTLYKNRNCETLSQSPVRPPCIRIHYTTAVPDGMIKGGITQIGLAQRIAYPYSHLVSVILFTLVEVSSFILSNNHTFIRMLLEFDYYVNLQCSCRLTISGSFYIVAVNTDIKFIPLLASVEITPFEELYKYDRKTGKVVAYSIPLHTTIYKTLLVRLQRTFLLETSYQMDIYWGKHEDPMEFTG